MKKRRERDEERAVMKVKCSNSDVTVGRERKHKGEEDWTEKKKRKAANITVPPCSTFSPLCSLCAVQLVSKETLPAAVSRERSLALPFLPFYLSRHSLSCVLGLCFLAQGKHTPATIH